MVNIGEIGDLVNIKYPVTELNPLAEFAAADNLGMKNVTSLIMEVPIACLTEGKGTIIGAWTTSSVPAVRTLSGTPAQACHHRDGHGRVDTGLALNMGGCKPSDAPAGSLHYTDGAYISDAFFANEFPYLRAPLKGSPNDDDALKAAKR